MKLTLDRDTLLYAVQRVQGLAERRTSLPILSSFLLEARASTSARIAATNLQIGIEMVVPAEVEQQGVVAIGARTLFEMLRTFPPTPVELEIDDQYWVHVRTGRIHFRIVGVSAEAYPHLPQPAKGEPEPASVISLPVEVLRNLIRRTIFSISSDETRPHLNSALFQGDGKILRIVTTDGHRMTVCEELVEADNRVYRHDILLPYRALVELRRMAEEAEGEIRLVFESPYLFLDVPTSDAAGAAGVTHRLESLRLTVKVVDATFPPYRQVIPRDNRRPVTIARDSLDAALRRISSISPSRTPTVRFQLDRGILKVSSDNPEVGIGEEEVDVHYEGDPLEIAFNAKYLLDVLEVVETENVHLAFGGPLDGCVIREQNNDRFLAVVMPIRI